MKVLLYARNVHQIRYNVSANLRRDRGEQMKFVAASPDVAAGGFGEIKFKRVPDVFCPLCQRKFYLWTSITKPKASEVQAAVKSVTNHLIESCPKGEHPDYIRIRD